MRKEVPRQEVPGVVVTVLTVRHVEAVCCYPHCPGSFIEPPHLLWHPRRGPEVLVIPVCGIGKIDLAVARVDGGVVERVELAAKDIVQNYCRNNRLVSISST